MSSVVAALRWATGARGKFRAARCRRLAFAAAAALLCAACLHGLESPRPPYPPAPAAAPRDEPDAAFRIDLDWSWQGARAAPAGLAAAKGALEDGALGLHAARQFTLAPEECGGCAANPALWWFRDEIVAVPAADAATGAPPVARTQPTELPDGPPPLPPVVWIGAPQLIEHATLEPGAAALAAGEARVPLAIAPPLPTNAAYVDASTVRFFAGRALRVRGAARVADGGPVFVVRTLWPRDARLSGATLALEPLRSNERLGTLIEAQADAAEPFATRLLLERDAEAPRRWAGKPALAFVLSGAQGDDDGSRSGHLAVATGSFGPQGEWADWIVNDFYPLTEANAKGIVPGPVPMDNYLLDLNSGQLYYRPAYMLVAVLRRARVASAVQAALQERMLRLYCGDVEFDLATSNSTALTIDPLRALGWRIPPTGPTSRIAGVVAAPLAVVIARRWASGRDVFAMLSQEKTRLLPRVAFEVAGHDLLWLAGQASGPTADELTPFERALVEDVEAIAFVRLPQVPSARRFGTYPVRSLFSYGADLLAEPRGFERAPEAGEREAPPERAAGCGPAGESRG